MEPSIAEPSDNAWASTPNQDGPFHDAIRTMQNVGSARRDATIVLLGDVLTTVHGYDPEYAHEMLLHWLCMEVRP